jgi:hypothetical protein
MLKTRIVESFGRRELRLWRRSRKLLDFFQCQGLSIVEMSIEGLEAYETVFLGSHRKKE